MIPDRPTAEDAERQLARLAELAGYDGEAMVVMARLAAVVTPTRPRPAGRPTPSAGLEERVRRSETRLRALVDQIPAVVFVAALGEDENEVYVSPQIETLLGFSQEEWLGNPLLWYSQLHPEDHDVVIEAFTTGVQTGGPFRAEVRFFARDGRLVWIHGEAQLIRDEHGHPEYFQGVGFDITPSKEAQQLVTEAEREKAEAAGARAAALTATNAQLLRLNEQLREATARAEEAAAARSTFLATMSHELRTPMNSVIVLACLLADTGLTTEQRDMLRGLELSADHLLSLINDILDFSRLRAGRVDLMLRPFDLRDWLEDTLDMVAPGAAEKFLGLRYTLEPGLPVRLVADDGRLRQVLLNLIGNAVKFTDVGEVEVSLRSRPAGDGLTRFECAVRDSGIGIAADRLGVLFEEFSQAEGGITREFGGTGLGLAISKSLVELMGGEVRVESARGAGSTFTFTWVCEARPAPEPVDPPPPLEGRRLLVVDDRAADAALLATSARSWGMDVSATTQPEEAMAWLREGRRYDLVIVGHNTSGPAALALARSISGAHPSPAPPIVLSAYAVHGPALRGDGFPYAGLLTKPVRQSVLRRDLAQALASGAWPGARGQEAREAPPVRSLRILVAEDNEMNQEVATLLLRSLGYRAEIVATGQEAVDAVRRADYDVVLMDMAMPGMDGLTATRLIRADGAAVHQPSIVALTANALPGDREICLAAGMDAYLPKPINRDDLAAVLAGATPPAAPESAGHHRAAHDGVVLAALRSDYGEESAVRLALLFRQGASGTPEAVSAALAEGQADEVYRLAHTLKSSARMIGASALADACERVETAARRGELAGITADVSALPGLVTAAFDWLDAAGLGDAVAPD